MGLIKTYGRKVIKVNYTEKELLEADEAKQKAIILDIIDTSKSVHEYNKLTTKYLQDYEKGVQDIRNKIKHTREEINNKTTENWAYAMVDFKSCYLLSRPIQYVQLNDSGEKEISTLNSYARTANKKIKDKDIFKDVLICGRGFRYTNFSEDNPYLEEDEKIPFELLNTNPEDTEVVYSNRLGNEQILSYIQTDMEYVDAKHDRIPYNEYTVYFRGKKATVDDKEGTLKVTGMEDIAFNDHVITEYYMNKNRISLIEIGKDLFDDINYLESLDKDDMEQFVNAILVFTNAEIDEEGLDMLKELGAVCISSTENRKASVELLQQRLNATDTQTYYTRLLTSLHQILAVPMATDNGSVTSGDTGKAKLTGQGYTMAGIRAEGEENAFGACDMIALRKILKICRETASSDIKNLKASEVEQRFQRDMTENLLVKTQALQTLYSCDIPRKFANAIIGLFGDPNAITQEQQKLFGDQVSQQSKTGGFGNEIDTTNEDDVVDKQNNDIQDTVENDNQEQ